MLFHGWLFRFQVNRIGILASRARVALDEERSVFQGGRWASFSFFVSRVSLLVVHECVTWSNWLVEVLALPPRWRFATLEDRFDRQEQTVHEGAGYPVAQWLS